MALDTQGYRDFAVAVQSQNVVHPEQFEVKLDPHLNGGADVLCHYTGILPFEARGKAGAWARGNLAAGFPTPGRKWQGSVYRGPGWTVCKGATVTLSLASVYNLNVANNAGWAVDAAVVEPMSTGTGAGDHLQILALLAVSDNDGILYRLSYQVTALGQTLQ